MVSFLSSKEWVVVGPVAFSGLDKWGLMLTTTDWLESTWVYMFCSFGSSCKLLAFCQNVEQKGSRLNLYTCRNKHS